MDVRDRRGDGLVRDRTIVLVVFARAGGGMYGDVEVGHCVSCYPTEDEDINLRIIPTLINRYNCPVGYSGHERGIAICTSAITLGACIIERHFTLDRTWKGTDHAASLSPDGLRRVVRDIGNVAKALELKAQDILPIEKAQRKKLKQEPTLDPLQNYLISLMLNFLKHLLGNL